MDDHRDQPFRGTPDHIPEPPQPPRPRRIRGTPEPMDGRCGAKLRRTDPVRYCAHMPLPTSRRCRYHGGATPRGIASHNFKTGMHSRVRWDYARVLGASRIGQLYAMARDADDPLSTKQQIALYESLVADCARALVTGEHVPKDAIDAWADVVDAQAAVSRTADGSAARASALARMSSALQRVGDAMTLEARQASVRAELDRRNLVLDRLKRTDLELQETRFRAFTAEQAFALIGSVAALVKGPIDTHVTDPLVRRSLLRDVAAGLASLSARRPEPPQPYQP